MDELLICYESVPKTDLENLPRCVEGKSPSTLKLHSDYKLKGTDYILTSLQDVGMLLTKEII